MTFEEKSDDTREAMARPYYPRPSEVLESTKAVRNKNKKSAGSVSGVCHHCGRRDSKEQPTINPMYINHIELNAIVGGANAAQKY